MVGDVAWDGVIILRGVVESTAPRPAVSKLGPEVPLSAKALDALRPGTKGE